MNQELYDNMYAILKELLDSYRGDRLSYSDYMTLKKQFIKQYIDYEEEFITVTKTLNCCIGDGVIVGSCIGLRCGLCFSELHHRLLNKYNLIE